METAEIIQDFWGALRTESLSLVPLSALAKEKREALERRRLKVAKYLEKSRKKRKIRVPCRTYEGRRKAAQNKPRENGRFVKKH